MRILHLLTVPLSIAQFKTGGQGLRSGGGWMAALVGRMLTEPGVTLACAAFGNTAEVEVFRNERMEYFLLPQRYSEKQEGLQICSGIVREWRPDLLHIHGTEGSFGLLTARGMVDCKAVISLQGLLGPYAEWHHFFGHRGLADALSMIRVSEFLRNRGLWGAYRQIKRGAIREREILGGNRFIMGRTDWDRSHARALNPRLEYYHVNEMLRDPFWNVCWSRETARPHRIIFTNAKHPRKGTEVLLEAVRLLIPDYPDVEVCIAGNIPSRSGYGKYLRRRFRRLGDRVVELGPLDAERMTDELVRSHVFVSPSFIDNSPNAVCEAQLVGMPVITTHVGGVPSLVDHGATGLFVPAGDAPMLAGRLRQIFENDGLASRLGNAAREAARRRHAPDTIVASTLSAYRHILDA